MSGHAEGYPDAVVFAARWWAEAAAGLHGAGSAGDPSLDAGMGGIRIRILGGPAGPTDEEIGRLADSLAAGFAERFRKDGQLVVACDYDPPRILSVALRELGLMRLALNVPIKTTMKVWADRIELKAGYDAPFETVWVQGFDFGDGPVPARRHVNPDGTEGGWVAETAHVAPTAYVGPDAWVFGNARVHDEATVCGDAMVYDNAQVSGCVQICEWAEVYGAASVSGHAEISDGASVGGNARVSGNAVVSYYAHVCGVAWVHGDAKVYDEAVLADGNWDTGTIHETPDGPKM